MTQPTHTLVTGYRKLPNGEFCELAAPMRVDATDYQSVMYAVMRTLPFVPYSVAAWHMRGDERIAGVYYANGEVRGRPAF